MENQLMKLEAPELQVIEKSKADQIRSTFEPMVEMLKEFESQFEEVISESTKEITKEVTAKAKRLRIDIGRVRIQTGKLKDEQKAEYLRAGNAIQAVHNILVWAVTDKENKLKEIENFFEIQEQKRLEALQAERVEKLLPYLPDAAERNLSNMETDVWEAYLSAKKKECEDRIAAEKKAEEDRIAREKAEAEERERIRIENERLKKEAEEKEREREKERAKAEAERKKLEEKAQKEREESDRKLKAEQEAARLAAEKAAAEKAKLEAELKAREDSDRKVIEEKEARIQAELNKGDSAKVSDLIRDLEELKTKYVFKSKKNRKMYEDCQVLLSKIIQHINR